MASKAATHYLQFDIQWSSLALLYYDYALTFPLEVKYIWGKKFRLLTILYVLCRYALIANVLYLLAIGNKLQQGCDSWYRIISALSIFGRAAVIFTFTGRIYAIFSRNRYITYILVYLGAIGLAAIGLDIFHARGVRCVGSSKNPTADLLLSILMVIFEYSVAILTLIRSVQAFRVGGMDGHRGGLIRLIFEQGVLYFSIVSFITTAAVILNVKAPAGFLQRLLNALLLPLSGLLTARFLLHLQVWETKHRDGQAAGQGDRGPNQDATLGSFRAAAGDVIGSIVDQFGEDPVEVAQRQGGAVHIHVDGQMVAGASEEVGDNPSHSAISMVPRKSQDEGSSA